MDRQADGTPQDPAPRTVATGNDDLGRAKNSTGPTLEPGITRDDLPPANTTRWVIRRKADVVQAVQEGVITLAEVCQRYGLSVEEYDSWHRLIERHGPAALRSTRLQDYRDASRRQR